MANKSTLYTPSLQNHVAVRMDCRIVVFSSGTRGFRCVIENWTYNMWTEQWREFPETQGGQLGSAQDLRGVAIRSIIYMFGGDYSSCKLWKLTQSTNGSYDWINISVENSKMPSPRCDHCGWEYGDKLWIFGGYGKSPVGFLNDHGDFFWQTGNFGLNNQLFVYAPSMQCWKNMECDGDVPSPRECASAAVVKDKAWLYGGCTTLGWEDKLYELNMISLTWTHIHTVAPRPPAFIQSLISPATPSQLVLHSGSHKDKSTWIFDVESHEWKQYQEGPRCYCIPHHTGTSGLNNDVIILLDHNFNKCEQAIFPLMLEPKNLQQLAVRMIYQNRNDLPLKFLPPSLLSKLFGIET